MQNKATKTLPNGYLVVALSKYDKVKVEWGIAPSKQYLKEAEPIITGSFYIERYLDDTWLPYEETFDEETKKYWKVLQPLCYKLGMRKEKDE